MAILTICERGNVRSITLATILKDFYGLQDIISAGLTTTTPGTLRMLCQWADHILLAVQPHLTGLLPVEANGKVVNLNIERDIWGQSMHPELVERCLVELSTLKFLGSQHPFYSSTEVYMAANRTAFERR